MARSPCPSVGQPPARLDPPPHPASANDDGKEKENFKKEKLEKGGKKPKCFCPPGSAAGATTSKRRR